MIIDCNKDFIFDTKSDPALVSGAQMEQLGLHHFPADALHYRSAADIS